MNYSYKKEVGIILLIFFVFGFWGGWGCSKEAKKERHLKRGEKYFSENKLREAIIEYKNVLQIDPRDAKVRYKLGLSHLKVGNLQEAFSEFTKSVDLDPEAIEPRIQLSLIHI